MFAPEGFLTARAVEERFGDAILARAKMKSLLPKVGLSDGSAAYRGSDLRLLSDAKEIFPLWAMCRLLGGQLIAPYICSPNGLIFKADRIFFWGGDLQFDDFTLPVEEDTELADFLEDYHRKGKGMDYSPPDVGWFTSSDIWLISEPNDIAAKVDELIAKERSDMEELFMDEDSSVATGKVDSIIRYYRSLQASVSRFSGWSICFKEADIPSDFDGLISLVGATIATAKNSLKGLKSSDIVDEIVALVDGGRTVKRDEIRRSLASGMKEEEWRATWAEARRQRPAISRRGPKPKTG